MKKSWVLNLVCIFLVFQCAAFQKTVKITPAAFEYQSISENYFSKGDEKPFPLTVQKGNNLYNSTTLDGHYLFYTTDHSGNYDIWFRDLRSAIIVPVTAHPAPEYKPAISPDGKKLLFVSEEHDSSGDIVLLEINPAKSMDKYLAGDKELSEEKIFLTNPNFSNPQKRDSFVDTDPAWSPDGKRIVFSSDRLSPGLQNLVLLDLTNKNTMTQLTNKGGASPQFSFDGKYIVYLSFQDSKEGDIYRFNLESGQEERLTSDIYMNFSPSLSPDGKFLYFTSIRKDSNLNGVLDLGDNSLIVKLDLITKEEKILTTDSISVFDTKFSLFNKGSILYSAALYNTINIYFIPESGPIPKKANIDEQYNFALRIKKNQNNYFLALDSVKLFYESDPLYPIYEAKIKDNKAEFKLEKGENKDAKRILDEMLFYENDSKNALTYAMGIRRIYRSMGKNADRKILDYYEKMKSSNTDKQVLASILKLAAGEKEKAKEIKEAKKYYQNILTYYPEYFEKREVKRKLAKLEFGTNATTIPEAYFELLSDSSTSLEDLRYILSDLENAITTNKNYAERIEYTTKLIEQNNLQQKSKMLFELVTYIKSKALSEAKKFQESNALIDSYLEPVKKNPDCDINPFCEKFRVCVRNPICLKSHLLKSKNFEGLGSVTGSFDELRVFLENYDPDLGVDLNKSEIEKTFRYYENKARDHEARGNSSPENRIHLRDAAFHYFFNVENMYLLKEKNLFVEDLYKDYAVYYQRKMVDSIFNYALKQAQDNKNNLLEKLNLLGEGKLNVVGKTTNLLSAILDNRLTHYLKFLGDFRDLNQETVLGKPGKPDDALKILDAHFILGRPRARPVLYLASLYGYAYYLINRSLIYETHYKSTNTMTPARKESILRDLRNAENELKWIIFADPLYADAHQLLGWLYQYIDIFKSTKSNSGEESDGEVYADLYDKYFSEKHFEENINLYKQVIDMLGDIQNKKILSDLNLNLANNYLLLQNYPKAKEHYAKVELYGQNILEQIQFENYKQTALFNYNYARSLISMGEYPKAIQYLTKTANIYYQNEYYEEIGNNPKGLNHNKKSKENVNYQVNDKLVLIYALIGLSERETGNYVNAINAYKKALALNYNSGYVDNINLYSSLALCYQKVEKYHLSDYYISKVETEYKKYKAKEKFKLPSFYNWFWNLILPDRVRVIGSGRFPGEFAPEEHYLLAQGIKIQNLSEQGEFLEVEKQIQLREEFLKNTGLSKLIIGEEIILNAKYKIGYDLFIQGKYENALSHYDNFLEQIKTNQIKTSNQTKERRKILKKKSYTLFRLVEAGGINNDKILSALRDNLNDLNLEKSNFLQACINLSSNEAKQSNALYSCEEKFDKEWYIFDPLLGLSYFYLGEILNSKREYDSAFYYYGLAIPLLKDPANVPVEMVGLPGDLFLKTERLRLKINLATIFDRLGDEKEFKLIITETEELAGEFQATEDLSKAKLLKAKHLFSKAKTKSDIKQVIQELEVAEKNIFRSYSTLIDLEDNFFHEIYSLLQEANFLLGNWKEIHSKEEKLYSILLFKHFQNTRVIFEEEKLEGLNQAVRETIHKDLENNQLYKLMVNTRKPLSNILGSRLGITNELERLFGLIIKFFPEKKRFFEISERTRPENISNDQTIFRIKQIQNYLVIHKISPSKDSYKTIPIKTNWKEDLERFFKSELETDKIKDLILIPDKSMASFDFGALTLQGKKLKDLVNLSYAFTLRQVNPVSHKNIKLSHIVHTTRTKENSEKIENNQFIEYKQSKKLGPIVNDSDILNTEIHYANGNIFSPSVNGYINLKEFTEKYSSISLVALNQSKLDESSYFRTIATVDTIQSAGIPLILISEDKSINPQEVNSLNSIKILPARSIGFYQDLFRNPDKSDYTILREEAFKWERNKKYNRALFLFEEADSFISPLSHEEKLESELNLARIKSKAIPKTKRFVFYERLLKKYNTSTTDKITIYEALLHQCYIQFSNQYCRDHFKNYYRTLKSASELDSETKDKSKVLVNFYIQVNNGAIQNLDRNYQNFLKIVFFPDLFLFHEDMCRFFLKNFILDKAEFHAKQLAKLASEKEEKEIAANLQNEIELQAFFTTKSNSINLREVSDSIYKDGVERNWNSVENKVNSLNRKTYDDALIKYRQKLFTIWKNVNLGMEVNPLQLVSEVTSTGKSIYSLMNQTDRALLFHLLLNSIKFQIKDEVNNIFDAFLDLQKEESRKIQNYYMQVAWTEELFSKGDYANAEIYSKRLDSEIGKISYDKNLLKRLYLAKFKILLRKEDSKKLLQSYNTKILEEDTDWYPYYKKVNSLTIDDFIPILNQIISEKKDFTFNSSNKREFLDFISYLELLSFRSNSSETFLDLAFYRDKIENMERLYSKEINFSQLPKAEKVTNALLKKVPANQEFIAVVNFGLQTFSIKIENGKSNGEIAFSDYRPIKNEIFSYHKQVKEKGNGLLLKDYLEPKFRSKILLKKNKLSYLYLSSFFIKTPLELKDEDNFYIVQNPYLLLSRNPKKVTDYTKSNFTVKKFNSSFPEDKELTRLENLEIKSEMGDSNPAFISGEKLNLSINTELQFGGNRLYNVKSNERKGFWFLANSNLYFTSFYKDDLNISLNQLDELHHGPGIFSISPQPNTANILFMKNFFQKTELQMNIKTRFIEAKKAVKSQYPQEINWNGYRLYTNTFLEE